MKEYKNYFFDLYGTLVDIHTDEDNPLFWTKVSTFLAMENIFLSPEVLKSKYLTEIFKMETEAKQMRGPWAEIDIEPVLRSFYITGSRTPNRDEIAQFAKIFRLFSQEKLRLFPGALSLLYRLKQKGKRIFLLSNAQSLFTMPELNALGITDLFDGILISSEAGFKKPDKRFYELAVKRFGLNPADSVMIGNDDQADCWGAEHAGLDSMYIATEQSPERTEPLPRRCRILKTIEDVL